MAETIDEARYVDLHDVIPAECFDDPRFANVPGYAAWEREIADPWLWKKGWTVVSWHTGDGDSFGPLTRYAKCLLRGREYRLVYG